MTALIFIASPLQLLNIRSAMSYFQISEYDMYILKDNNSDRHVQISKMANFFGYKFEVIDFYKKFVRSRKSLYFNFLKFCISNKYGQYDFLFIGDYRSSHIIISQVSNLKKGGKVCFIDDGNASINILQGKDVNIESKIIYGVANIIYKLKSLIGNLYYTSYYDIPTNRFKVIPNTSMEVITDFPINDIIIFIGTNTNVYVEYFNISMTKFLNKLSYLFSQLKNENPEKRIVYIPHGRDTQNEIKTICEEHGIEYWKIEVCVEFYMLQNKIYPSSIYAIGSSALFNLRKMFPKSLCVNLNMHSESKKIDAIQIYTTLYEYYEKYGIKNLSI